MAKDYFQDIKLSPEDEQPAKPKAVPLRRPAPRAQQKEREETVHINVHNADHEQPISDEPVPSRGIRNISLPARGRPRIDAGEPRGSFGGGPILPPRRSPVMAGGMGKRAPRIWLWIIIVLCLIVVGGASLFVFRPTTVTITPRSHVVTFDSSSQFTAYPADSAATDTLPYTVVTQTFNASQSVPSSGTQEVQEKASGMITVYNDYSTSAQHLIANTRFETSDGLIFRTPTAITIPGKTGSTPGQVNVSVVADQTGPSYNIGPVSRFTIPGLQSSPSQYQEMYGVSTAPMTGGFSGEKPGVSPTDEANAVSALQSQLAQQAAKLAQENNNATTTALAGLAQVTYQELPESTGSDGSAEINESAQVELPVFPASAFASTVAQTVSADVGDSPVTLIPQSGFSAVSDDATTTALGSDELDFSLSGQAEIVWQVDVASLTQALAGKSQSGFTTIVNGFSGIQQASARIEPFWKSTFPTNPADIKVIVEQPQNSS